MPVQTPSLLWFHRDLRLADNPALLAASERGAPIVAIYVLDEDCADGWPMGGASRWWLHHSLEALGESLRARNITLILRRGAARTLIPAVAEEIGAGAVFWNRCYEPSAVARETAIRSALEQAKVTAASFPQALLIEPWEPKTKSGTPFKVFTPFWRWLRGEIRPPQPRKPPKPTISLPIWKRYIRSDELDDWQLLPTRPNWAKGFGADWQPGEAGAQARLGLFIENGLNDYANGRDLPGQDLVSRLSPHLHWGELSVRQLWHTAELHAGTNADAYLRELGWREFAHHLLWQFPDLPVKPFNPRYTEFPWRSDATDLQAWQRGETGYPIVDAGMRQLWQTGWMHNRVRLVTASFLVKHLLLSWREGEAWFWDCLVDADLANNAMNWQWIAGSGADAAPYFRIFNPVTQGERFDGNGDYVRRWVPEIAKLPDMWLHKPWEAPPGILATAGVKLGRTYPAPIVDHAMARNRALEALRTIRA